MKFEFSTIKHIFWNGLVAIIPLTITIALIVWLLTTIDGIFAFLIVKLFPGYYIEGMGILLGLIFTFIAGFILQGWAAKRFQEIGEEFIQKIPFVKTLYNGVRDLLTFFRGKEKPQQRVVLVNLPYGRAVGFITKETFEGLPSNMAKHDEVIVYIPLSYQIGGLTLIVSKHNLEPLDMSIEDAMRFVVLAGMTSKSQPTIIEPKDINLE